MLNVKTLFGARSAQEVYTDTAKIENSHTTLQQKNRAKIPVNILFQKNKIHYAMQAIPCLALHTL